MAPPELTTEAKVMLLEDHESERKPHCERFHSCMYGFIEVFNKDYKPHIDSWAGFKKWMLASALAILILLGGIFRQVVVTDYRLAALEKKTDPFPAGLSEPQQGDRPTVPEGYTVVPKGSRVWEKYNNSMEAKP